MENKNIIVLDFLQDNQFHAGSKAREDVNEILVKNNCSVEYINIALSEKMNIISKIIRNISYYVQIKKIINKTSKNSIVIVQYPFIKMSVMRMFVKLLQKHNIKVISLVHDIDTIRFLNSENGIKSELKTMSISDCVIVHNESMKNLLVNQYKINSNKLVSLEIFDYLVDNTIKQVNNCDFKKVIIAGNLSVCKSAYIYELNNMNISNYQFDLYGVNYNGESTSNIIYKGVFSPNDIPFDGGFGLVWDGDSIKTCTGNTGEYTKINNPHKLSLYMAAGIPVFVWKEAAIANFVNEHKLGFCISSLDEIDEIMGNITYEDYQQLLNNVQDVSKKVKEGYYIISAITKAINKLGIEG